MLLDVSKQEIGTLCTSADFRNAQFYKHMDGSGAYVTLPIPKEIKACVMERAAVLIDSLTQQRDAYKEARSHQSAAIAHLENAVAKAKEETGEWKRGEVAVRERLAISEKELRECNERWNLEVTTRNKLIIKLNEQREALRLIKKAVKLAKMHLQ